MSETSTDHKHCLMIEQGDSFVSCFIYIKKENMLVILYFIKMNMVQNVRGKWHLQEWQPKQALSSNPRNIGHKAFLVPVRPNTEVSEIHTCSR